MLTNKRVGLVAAGAAVGMLSVLFSASLAQGVTYSDRGSAVLVFPKIAFVDGLVDTQVTVANLNAAPTSDIISAHCFYVNSNSHCSNTGAVCTSAADCDDDGFFGSCVPGWIEVNFDINLTPGQPLVWLAGSGLSGSDTPCPGGFGARCSGNQGTRVPPVAETPFIGELKCIQSDPATRRPKNCAAADCANNLVGDAVIETVGLDIDVAKYNAVGLRTAGDNDGDNVLVIGGDGSVVGPAEYQPCSEVLVLDHLFDGACDPISGPCPTGNEAATTLTLVPCTQDFLTQEIPPVTAQFLIYNEFEQRFSTSRQVRCYLDTLISLIDTSQSARSIFSAGVAGTVAGQTRIRGVNGGLIGSAVLDMVPQVSVPFSRGSAGYSLNQVVERSEADFITIP